MRNDKISVAFTRRRGRIKCMEISSRLEWLREGVKVFYGDIKVNRISMISMIVSMLTGLVASSARAELGEEVGSDVAPLDTPNVEHQEVKKDSPTSRRNTAEKANVAKNKQRADLTESLNRQSPTTGSNTNTQ
jgi:hypothetical protein